MISTTILFVSLMVSHFMFCFYKKLNVYAELADVESVFRDFSR